MGWVSYSLKPIFSCSFCSYFCTLFYFFLIFFLVSHFFYALLHLLQFQFVTVEMLLWPFDISAHEIHFSDKFLFCVTLFYFDFFHQVFLSYSAVVRDHRSHAQLSIFVTINQQMVWNCPMWTKLCTYVFAHITWYRKVMLTLNCSQRKKKCRK